MCSVTSFHRFWLCLWDQLCKRGVSDFTLVHTSFFHFKSTMKWSWNLFLMATAQNRGLEVFKRGSVYIQRIFPLSFCIIQWRDEIEWKSCISHPVSLFYQWRTTHIQLKMLNKIYVTLICLLLLSSPVNLKSPMDYFWSNLRETFLHEEVP